MKNLIVGISGASGIAYSISLLKILRKLSNIKIHLIISSSAKKVISIETNLCLKEIESLAHVVYDINDIASQISSGSFKTNGMIILPCSIRTLSGIVNSYNSNLLIRAADITLKEKRKLILAVRETPLHSGHLLLMQKASELGAIIMPPVPAFYHCPKNIDDLINQTVNRMLDQFDIQLKIDLFKRWEGK